MQADVSTGYIPIKSIKNHQQPKPNHSQQQKQSISKLITHKIETKIQQLNQNHSNKETKIQKAQPANCTQTFQNISKSYHSNIKEKNPIKNLFSQFFKLQNLKNYQKKAHIPTIPAHSQVNSVQDSTILDQENQKQQKSLIQQNLCLQKSESYQALAQIKSRVGNQPVSQKKNYSQQAHTLPTIKEEIIEKKLFPKLNDNSNSKKVNEEILEIRETQSRDNKIYFKNEGNSLGQRKPDKTEQGLSPTTNDARNSYQEPNFKFMNVEGPNQEPVSQDSLIRKKQSISFDEETPISPQTLEQFLNSSQLKHPFFQCSSKESFLEDCIQQDKTFARIKNKKQQNKVLNDYSKSLNNLVQFSENVYSCQDHEDSLIAPFIHRKQRDSELAKEQIKNQLVLDSCKKLNKTYSEQQNLEFNTVNVHKSQISKPSIAKLFPQSPKHQMPKIQLESETKPKRLNRLNKFMSIQDEMKGIRRMFKDFDLQNKMMLDVLSYNSGFQTLEEVSNNLVNEMDKENQSNYINQVIELQKEWKMKLVKNQMIPQNANSQTCLINQPRPTKTCSPSKYSQIQQNEAQIQHQPTNIQNQNLKIVSSQLPLRLPTFSYNLSNYFQFESEFIQNNSQHKQSNQPKLLTVNETNYQSIARDLSCNHQQRDEIREFYHYLQSKQPSYQQFSNNSTELEKGVQSSSIIYLKNMPGYKSLHEIKETSKPYLTQNTTIPSNQLTNGRQEMNMIPSKSDKKLSSLVRQFKMNRKAACGQNEQLLNLNSSLEYSIHLPDHQEKQGGGKDTDKVKEIFQNFAFPIEKIQPIKVVCQNKFKKVATSLKKGRSTQKIRVISASAIEQNKKPPTTLQVLTQLPNVAGNSQISNAMGSFRPNRGLRLQTKSYLILGQHINSKDIDAQLKPPKIQQIIPNSNQLHTQKKKILIKKSEGSSKKKLSINQKIYQLKKQTNEQATAFQISSSVFHNLNPKLQQTIQRINQKSSAQLHNLIKSRISERSDSKTSSVHKSPLCNKLKDEPKRIQRKSFLGDNQLKEKQFTPSKNTVERSIYKQFSLSQSKSMPKKGSSKSCKRSGLELWNQGLSGFKQSRRQDSKSSSRIFIDQCNRQNQKIIGITKWNDNLSRFKHSRTKSKQSQVSGSKSQKKSNFINGSISQRSERPQTSLNVQIKRYKHQVTNIQRKYL